MFIQRIIFAALGFGALIVPVTGTAQAERTTEVFDTEMCGGFLLGVQLVGNYTLMSNIGTVSSQGYTMPMQGFTTTVTIFVVDDQLSMVSDDGHLNFDLGLPNVEDNLPMLDAMHDNWLNSDSHNLPSLEDIELAIGCENDLRIPVFAGAGTVLSEDNEVGPAKMNLYIHGAGEEGIHASGLLLVEWPGLVMRLMVSLDPI